MFTSSDTGSEALNRFAMIAQPLQSRLPLQHDARADGGERHVALGSREVLIERSLGGVRMRLRLPTRAYRGVVLSLGEAVSGKVFYRISLWHADPDFTITLEEATDDRDIVAEWKSWAAHFALPKFIERSPGQLEGAETRLGAVAIGAARPSRRRGASISKRRGRLPLRRKPGRPGAITKVIGGEPMFQPWEGPRS